MTAKGAKMSEQEAQAFLAEIDFNNNGRNSLKNRDTMANLAREIDELQKAFYNFDNDQTGTIDADELYWLMTAKGAKMSEQEAQAFLAEIDFNNNGKINYAQVADFLINAANQQ
eukprot:TRINITY_DN133_c0_g1_i1.p1 TRINITY_DN133_c0_g1~~TRINITY_DN133_c0_g1_i1.p1  ORF type:complete len:114 (-),score=32.97 TRINITY_DN133_c0_g1_i1:44-385(-)